MRNKSRLLITSAFRVKPRRMLEIVQRFCAHCSLQGVYADLTFFLESIYEAGRSDIFHSLPAACTLMTLKN